MIEYSPDEVTFFGYKGRVSTTGQLSGLALIGYVTSCVDKFKQELGNEFVWFTPEPEPEPEEEKEENEGEEVTPGPADGDAVEEDDSGGMSAAGVVFLVLFLLGLTALIIYGAYLYRKDKQCFRNNWNKCKSGHFW